MEVGNKVIAKIDMVSDLSEAGFGTYLHARKGEELIIRGKSPYQKNTFYVSHEGVTNGSLFCAHVDELELIKPK